VSDLDNQTVPVAIHESWRAWLMTGTRRTPVDRRRMRGAHKGLKKILLEGLSNGGDRTYAWKDFSGAMVRHAVDDAMRALPPEYMRVVKLAYFGGYSNREIAREVGLTEATVQRRLRRALGAISYHIQHGRAVGRRAVYAVSLFLSGRWLNDTAQHMWTATAVAGAAIVITAAQAAPAPAPAYAPDRPAAQATAQPGSVVPPVPSPTVPVKAPSAGSKSVSVPATLPAPAPAIQPPTVQVPVVNLPVALPSVSPLPDKVKKLI